MEGAPGRGGVALVRDGRTRGGPSGLRPRARCGFVTRAKMAARIANSSETDSVEQREPAQGFVDGLHLLGPAGREVSPHPQEEILGLPWWRLLHGTFANVVSAGLRDRCAGSARPGGGARRGEVPGEPRPPANCRPPGTARRGLFARTRKGGEETTAHSRCGQGEPGSRDGVRVAAPLPHRGEGPPLLLASPTVRAWPCSH